MKYLLRLFTLLILTIALTGCKMSKQAQLKKELIKKDSHYTYINNKGVVERYYTINDYILLHLIKHPKDLDTKQIEYLKARFEFFNGIKTPFSFEGPIIIRPPRCPIHNNWGLGDAYKLLNLGLPPNIVFKNATLVNPRNENILGGVNKTIISFDKNKIKLDGVYHMKINLYNKTLNKGINIDQVINLKDRI